MPRPASVHACLAFDQVVQRGTCRDELAGRQVLLTEAGEEYLGIAVAVPVEVNVDLGVFENDGPRKELPDAIDPTRPMYLMSQTGDLVDLGILPLLS